MPAYSGDSFLKNNVFHIDKSIDRNGLLPLTALKSKRYYRTPQPLHSYLVFENLSKILNNEGLKPLGGKIAYLNGSQSTTRECACLEFLGIRGVAIYIDMRN